MINTHLDKFNPALNQSHRRTVLGIFISAWALLLLSACGDFQGVQSLKSSSSSTPAPDEPGNTPQPDTGMVDTSNLLPVAVATSSEMADAIKNMEPGQAITLKPGTYIIERKIYLTRGGTEEKPIAIRGEKLGDVTIKVQNAGIYAEGFIVDAPNIILENLIIEGDCGQEHDSCEHGIHLKNEGDDLVVQNNVLRNFNAHIKSGGQNDPRDYPDRVVINNNTFYNDTQRYTNGPVTPIDVNGGHDWVVRNNTIADFVKKYGNGVSYGAFLKANSRRGLFENNLVVCNHKVSGGYTLGLSFGGGGNPGANNPACEYGSCHPLHRDGIMRNNIIMNCSDVGIYINEGQNSLVTNNTLVNTAGIDIRFAESSAVITNNLMVGGGDISWRDSANRILEDGNAQLGANALNADLSLSTDFSDSVVGQGVLLPDSYPAVVFDFCGQQRSQNTDIGAIEYATGSCVERFQKLYGRLPN